MPSTDTIERAYALAKERYAEVGVNTDDALRRLRQVPISLHCWQGDDVRGFESDSTELSGGIAVTGNYPGAARSPDELRSDLEKAYALIPGKHRLNLHASYLDTKEKPGRDAIRPEHYRGWIDWAKAQGLGMDFNPTYFSHPLAADGFTLTHRDDKVRDFWINHGIACRRIGAAIGQALGSPCVTNIWIPDGMKDTPADRADLRVRLAEALDRVLAEPLDKAHNLDSVESKLFGIGSESYVVGSHEFYLGYAIRKGILYCLDAGHYHPTESIADKLSAIFCHLDRLLLHVSRGVRWDSDHVVTLTDELRAIAQELVRGDYLGRTHVGLDFFDGSINRVAAWVIGTRSMIKALLMALLEPLAALRAAEAAGDYTTRLALMEEVKTLPAGAVWDYYCLHQGVPVGCAWMDIVRRYERDVLSRRSA